MKGVFEGEDINQYHVQCQSGLFSALTAKAYNKRNWLMWDKMAGNAHRHTFPFAAKVCPCQPRCAVLLRAFFGSAWGPLDTLAMGASADGSPERCLPCSTAHRLCCRGWCTPTFTRGKVGDTTGVTKALWQAGHALETCQCCKGPPLLTAVLKGSGSHECIQHALQMPLRSCPFRDLGRGMPASPAPSCSTLSEMGLVWECAGM